MENFSKVEFLCTSSVLVQTTQFFVERIDNRKISAISLVKAISAISAISQKLQLTEYKPHSWLPPSVQIFQPTNLPTC